MIEKWRELESPDNTKSREEKKKVRDGIIRELEMHYWRYVQVIESKIESKKKKFTVLIERIYEYDKICEDLKKMVRNATYAKLFIKVVNKITTAATVKLTAKALPGLGAVLGLAFGSLRLFHGDVAGAGLEFASGVASCYPGAGTAASLAIDVGIARRDTIKAKEKYKIFEEVFYTLYSASLVDANSLCDFLIMGYLD